MDEHSTTPAGPGADDTADPNGDAPSGVEALLGALGLGATAGAAEPASVAARTWVIPGYEFLREIARGGMGAVLAARDPKFDREVAVKVLTPDPAAGTDPDSARRREAARRRFLVESRITAALPHPNIPPAYDLGTLPDGEPFLAMKYIRGRTFADHLAARPDPATDLPRMLLVLEQVAQAVGFAHAQGVIHRDLKPLNVMVGAFGEVLVMDWGLAKDTRRPAAEPADVPAPLPDDRPGGLTAAGEVMGTIAYMPPEQAAGRTRDVDSRSDVFGLGAILCEVLTGHPPFSGLSAHERLRKAAACDLRAADARLNGCGADPELVALARRCMAANPADRPADGQAVADALAAHRLGVEERLRRAETDRATAAVRAAEGRKRARVRRWLATAVGVAAVVGAAGAFAGVMWHRAEDARDGLDGANRDLKAQQELLADANTGLTGQTKRAEAATAEATQARGRAEASDAARVTHFAHRALDERGPTHARRLLATVAPDRRGWEWDFVSSAARPPIASAKATSFDATRLMAVSPDGHRALAFDMSLGTILFETPSLKRLREFGSTPQAAVILVAFADGGRECRLLHHDGTVSRHDAEAGEDRGRVRLHGFTPGGFRQTVISRDGSRVTTARGESLRVWDAKTGQSVATLPFPPVPKSPAGPPTPDAPDPPYRIEALELRASARGDLLAAGVRGGRVPVYHVGAAPRLLIPDLRALLPDGEWSGGWAVSDDGTAVEVETASGEVVFVNPYRPQPVRLSRTIRLERNGLPFQPNPRQLRFTPDGRFVVALGEDGRLDRLPVSPPTAPGSPTDPDTAGTLAPYHVGNRSVLIAVSDRCAAVAPQDQLKVLKVYDFASGGVTTLEASFLPNPDVANSLGLSSVGLPDRGGWVVVNSIPAGGQVVPPAGPGLVGEVIRETDLQLHDLSRPAVSAATLDTRVLGTGVRDQLTDATCRAVCPATGQILCGGSGGQLARFDPDTGTVLSLSRPHSAPLLAVGASRDGTTVATGDINGTVRVTGAGAAFENPGWPVAVVAVSANGARVAAVFEAPPAARVWSRWAERRVGEPVARHGRVRVVVDEPPEITERPGRGREFVDEPLVFTDRPGRAVAFELRVWDRSTGRLAAALPVGNVAPKLAFSDDSADLYAGLHDGTFGRVDVGGEWRVLAKAGSPIAGVWGTAGRAVFAADRDGGPRVCDPATGKVTPMSVGHSAGIAGLTGDAATGRIVTWASHDVKVWSIDSGHEVLDFTFPPINYVGGDEFRFLSDRSLIGVTTGWSDQIVTRFRATGNRPVAFAPAPRAVPESVPPPRQGMRQVIFR